MYIINIMSYVQQMTQHTPLTTFTAAAAATTTTSSTGNDSLEYLTLDPGMHYY